ncbi:TetR/AcrR family transcriptional regulator [Agromyces mangrovi Wang et al. 2018]|uniref:TetR/AcrR family transcriptional regulator n=1 Tax=Agromyces mangrovi TaxID=1858653 RepID=UPI0025748A8C|nr:TetR/AcrR family transcriptional regulator [Agromyces mangrovi]BDZ65215.1 TetR family transcriptional regulator [Agromyces mangrovi]
MEPTAVAGREALLASLERLARERGLANVGLREVARDAGLSHAAPAHFFGSREGMLRALAGEGLRLLYEDVCEAQETPGAVGRERLVVDALAFVRFALAHPAHFDAVFRTPAALRGDAQFEATRAEALGSLRELVELVRAEGGLGPDADVDTVVLQHWALSHGVASLAIDGMLGPDGDPAITEAAERIVRGHVAGLP